MEEQRQDWTAHTAHVRKDQRDRKCVDKGYGADTVGSRRDRIGRRSRSYRNTEGDTACHGQGRPSSIHTAWVLTQQWEGLSRPQLFRVHMCTCVCTRTHTCTQCTQHTCTCVPAWVHVPTHTGVHAHTCVQGRTYVQVCTHVHNVHSTHARVPPHGYMCPHIQVYRPTRLCTEEQAHTQVHRPDWCPTAQLQATPHRMWNYTVPSLQRPPLTSHTQTRGAVVLRWDSGFGQEACIQQDGQGLARLHNMPVTPPSPHPAGGGGQMLPAAPGGAAPSPGTPDLHAPVHGNDLSPFHLFSQIGFSSPKPL